jgi:hypothetical protein
MTVTTNVVSGAMSSLADLGRDEAWLQGWLRDQPSRLGLGELKVAEGEPVQDDDGNPAFVAIDGERSFCVDVRLGELDASQGFSVLHNWASNRNRDPERQLVAVLVTETAGDRYRPTLETLSEHLPLVVVELQLWRGESEAIIVPHVALASRDVDLSATPAAAAAKAVARRKARVEVPTAAVDPGTAPAAAKEVAADADTAAAEPASKDDTGVADPWGLPKPDAKDPEPGLSGTLIGVTGRQV